MSGKKLNMKRVKSVMLWSSMLLCIGALLFMSVIRKQNVNIRSVDIKIEGIDGGDHMISEKEIKDVMMKVAGKPLTKANIKSINLRKIEAKLNKDKRIERADIYFDSKYVLHVIINQKKPIMRVIDETSADYYIDQWGKVIPVTPGNPARVPVVTGMKEKFDMKKYKIGDKSKWNDLYDICLYIKNDEFLHSLVEQVHVESDSIADIVIIPKIGREKIIVGDASNLKEKFDNLKIFYREGLPRLGWGRYKSLNIKITNQIAGQLSDPNTEKIKQPEIKRDTLAELATDINPKESIHH